MLGDLREQGQNQENTMIYTQLMNYESDEWNTAHARNLEEEDKLLQAGFEFVRYDERNELAIYRKRKGKRPRFDGNSYGLEMVSRPLWPLCSRCTSFEHE